MSQRGTGEPIEQPLLLGWREWLALPKLDIPAIKAKVDTGARSSCIHAENIRTERRDGVDIVTFDVAPLREHSRFVLHCASPVHDERYVRSSSGERDLRLFVRTRIEVGGLGWSMQVSLADRRKMRFPMLLGRSAMARRVVVDPARSYLTGRRLPHRYRDLGLIKRKQRIAKP